MKKVNVGIPYGASHLEEPAIEGGVDYRAEAVRLKDVIASTCGRLPGYEESAALARRVRIFGESGVRTKSPVVERNVAGALEEAASCGADSGVRAAGSEGLKKIESKPGPSPFAVSASIYISPCG